MTKNNVTRVVVYIIILLAIFALIGVVAYFTNGFTSDFKTFFVKVNGRDVMNSSSGYSISESKPLKVDVRYTFGFVSKEDKDYSVKIVPNKIEGYDFNYTVGDETHSFFEETDLTDGFIIVKTKDSFTVTPKGKSLNDILGSVYPEEEISNCEGFGYADMFTVIVTSYNQESWVKLNFVIDGIIIDVSIDPGVVVF